MSGYTRQQVEQLDEDQEFSQEQVRRNKSFRLTNSFAGFCRHVFDNILKHLKTFCQKKTGHPHSPRSYWDPFEELRIPKGKGTINTNVWNFKFRNSKSLVFFWFEDQFRVDSFMISTCILFFPKNNRLTCGARKSLILAWRSLRISTNPSSTHHVKSFRTGVK